MIWVAVSVTVRVYSTSVAAAANTQKRSFKAQLSRTLTNNSQLSASKNQKSPELSVPPFTIVAEPVLSAKSRQLTSTSKRPSSKHRIEGSSPHAFCPLTVRLPSANSGARSR